MTEMREKKGGGTTTRFIFWQPENVAFDVKKSGANQIMQIKKQMYYNIQYNVIT